MRALVKIAIAGGRHTQDQIANLIINPKSGKPIDSNTLRKHFAREIATAREEIEMQMHATLIDQAKKGSLGHLIWFEKTRLGIRDPDNVREPSKVDAANHTVRHVVEYRGGLPKGSTPENPQGEAPDIPPEEAN